MEGGPRQRTLFDLGKVVKLDSSSVCFSQDDILRLKAQLLDPGTSKLQLLNSLRKLDCYRLELQDLVATQIGCAVATLCAHPQLEVSRLAGGLADKWQALVESVLFRRLPYDVQLAAAAPQGCPLDFKLVAPLLPPPPPAEEEEEELPTEVPERHQPPRGNKGRAERVAAEEDFLAGSSGSDEDAIEEDDEDADFDWRPGHGGSGGGGGHKKQRRQSAPQPHH